MVADAEEEEGDYYYDDDGPEVNQLGAEDRCVFVREDDEVIALDVEEGKYDNWGVLAAFERRHCALQCKQFWRINSPRLSQSETNREQTDTSSRLSKRDGASPLCHSGKACNS